MLRSSRSSSGERLPCRLYFNCSQFAPQHQTNQQPALAARCSRVLRSFCSAFSHHFNLAVETNNFRRLLRTVEALSELGPELTAEREFSETSRRMLSAIMEAAGAREGALFIFNEKPTMLTSVASQGFAHDARAGVHSASSQACPRAYRGTRTDRAERFHVFGISQLERQRSSGTFQVHGAAQGGGQTRRRRSLWDGGPETRPTKTANWMPWSCCAAILGWRCKIMRLRRPLAQRVTENLRLMASLHGFYDTALEAFATAIDVKHVNIHGHSLRVGRYAAAIGEAMGVDAGEVAALRSAGYLHDIGKVAVDRRLFGKAGALESRGVSRDGGSHRGRPSDCQQRRVSLAEDSRVGALAS